VGGGTRPIGLIPDDALVVSALTSIDWITKGFLGLQWQRLQGKEGVARGGKPFVLGSQKFLNVEPVLGYTGESYFFLAS